MAIIEELPDSAPPMDLENLNLNDMISAAAASHFGTSTSTNITSSSTPGAALPPVLANMKSQTAEEFIRSMNKMPLFMTTLDETGADDTSPNDALEALKALQYEGSARDIMVNFKDNGNECFRAKQYKDARAFYTKALAVEGCDQERELRIQCMNNRAQCNLAMQNFGKCIVDCREVLRLDAKQSKAWFRAAKALLELGRFVEAAECCGNTALLEPTHTQIRELEGRIKDRRELSEKRERERVEREKREKEEARKVEIAAEARGIATRDGFKRGDGIGIGFASPGDPATEMVLPVVLVYYTKGSDLRRVGLPGGPESDLVKDVPESSTVADVIGEVLSQPPLWGDQRLFTPKAVEAYCETVSGGLVKAGSKLSLLEVLSGGKVVVVEGVLAIYVVPKPLVKDFVDAWKTQRIKKQ